MRPRSSTLFPLALVISLALLSFWLEHAVRSGDQEGSRALRHEPDFIIENFTTTELGKQGRPSATLSARRMVHFPDDDTSELDAPHLIHYSPLRPPVHITADRGLVIGTGEEVRLYDNVVVRRTATAEKPELRVETSYLQVFPDKQLARTPEAVLITEGASRLKGVGMEIDNQTGQMKLGSRVSGVYVKSGGSGR